MSEISTPQPKDTISHNLPLQLTSFIGREREVDELSQVLDVSRLVTLTGTGGVGKTRLGLTVASHNLDQFVDGAWFVGLGSIYESHLVVHKVSSTLDCRGEGSKSRLKTLQEFLQIKDMLLVLDNCEHLLDACAELVVELLVACPKLQVLATSREPLGVPGEKVYEVPPLSLPDIGEPLDRTNLLCSETVRLFIERARDFQSDFQFDDDTAPAIVNICNLLDGIPLAVELTAARLRMFSLAQIASYLEDSLRFLTRGSRTIEPRHQTMQACIDWSYSLLDKDEQLLFRRLAIFAGEFTLEDVEAVCSGEFIASNRKTAKDETSDTPTDVHDLHSSEMLDSLSALVEKSLVRVEANWEASFRLLIPIQQFAWRKLSESGELDLLRNWHLAYYLKLAQKGQPALKRGAQSVWLNRFELEFDNMRAALDWSLEGGELDTGLRLASKLGDFWWRHGYYSEGLEWLSRLLAMYKSEDRVRASAFIQAGRLSRERGDYELADSFCQQSLVLSQELKFQEGIALSLSISGTLAHYLGEREQAIELLEKSLAHHRYLGDEWNTAAILIYLADIKLRDGENEQANSLYRESLSLFRKLDDKWGIAYVLGGLGNQALLERNYEQALIFNREALELSIEQGNKVDIAYSLEALAVIYNEQRHYQLAARLWGFAAYLRESIHSSMPPIYQKELTVYLEAARSALEEDAFHSAWHDGRALTLEDAVAMAIQPSLDEPEILSSYDARPTTDPDMPDRAERYGLTRREVDVLRLVATGLTDAQVAEQLYISPRTVSKHLQSVYGKIEVKSRSAATRFALEHDIV